MPSTRASVTFAIGALLTGCSGSSTPDITIDPPHVDLIVDGLLAGGMTERQVPLSSTMSIRSNNAFVDGWVRVQFWPPSDPNLTGDPELEFFVNTDLTFAQIPFLRAGTYDFIGQTRLASGVTASTPPLRVRTSAFNARIRLIRNPGGDVPILGLEPAAFELVTLDGTPVMEFEYVATQFIDPSQTSDGRGQFPQLSTAGSVFSIGSRERAVFTPLMTSLANRVGLGIGGQPHFAFVPLATWGGDATMPRHELVSGRNEFELVLGANSDVTPTGGRIEVRDRTTGQVSDFPLDVPTNRVAVDVPARIDAEFVDIRAAASFAEVSGEIVTDWLPAVVVPE